MTEPSLLSEREREVASLLLQGKGNKQIAAMLDVTIHTVEFHLSNIYTKLKESNGKIIISFGFTVFHQDSKYKLVDIDSNA
jgi:DNA-binding NarL/FixJ family response regulator